MKKLVFEPAGRKIHKAPPSALLDDDDEVTPSKKPVKSDFWDADDQPAPQNGAATKATGKKPVIAPVIKPVKPVDPPDQMFNIQCGDDRILVIDRLDSGGQDLLCYHYRMGCTIHLKRQDLIPSEAVASVLSTIADFRRHS